jgi:hypothetical protein
LGFSPLGVANSWSAFNNDGYHVIYGYHDDTWAALAYDGGHSELIEIDTTPYQDTVPDRVSGLCQTVSGLKPGSTYRLTLNGEIRTNEGDRHTDDHSYIVQWGIDPKGGADQNAVATWTEVPWYHAYYRLSPGPTLKPPRPLDHYVTEFAAPSDRLTLFIQLYKRPATGYSEVTLNLDGLSLFGPIR